MMKKRQTHDGAPPHRPSSPPRPRPARRRTLILVVGVGVVALLAGAAVLAARRWSASVGEAQGLMETRPVEVSGTPLPTLGPNPDPNPDPAVGRPMPELRGAAFDGHPVRILKDGKAKLLVCLAHWCPHCQREVPLVAAWLREGRIPPGVEVYAVATGTRPDWPNYPPSAWLKRENWPTPVLVDDDNGVAARAVGLSAYPFFVLVNAAGTVVYRHAGEIPIPELDRLVASVKR